MSDGQTLSSPIDPWDLHLDVHVRSKLRPEEPGDHLVHWRAALVWSDWSTSENEPQDITVATVDAYTLDWIEAPDPPESILDAHSGDLAEYACLFNSGDLHDDLDDDLDILGGGIVILDRILVPPDWRGQRLGPLAAASTLRLLGEGRGLAACYPAPFELEPDDPRRPAAQMSLERLWGRFGFEPWTGGVWVLNLALKVLGDSYRELLETVGQGGHDR